MRKKWINFLCRPDIALKNFEYITYATPNKAAKELLDEDCLLYTSDAADDSLRVDLGGRRIIKKKFFQAEDGIRDRSPSRGLGDVYKRQ